MTSNVESMATNNPIIYSNRGFRDKEDKNSGLYKTSGNNITVRNNLIFCDTRDCVGANSIRDTQSIAEIRGTRPEFYGTIKNVSGDGVSPILITCNSIISNNELKDGDKVSITGVQGNKAANGLWVIQNFTVAINSTFELSGSLGNGNYAGGGTFIRPADPGWPTVGDETSFIEGNEMLVKLPKKLKVIRSLSLIHSIIPRDIIPLIVYLPDFLEFTQFDDSDIPAVPSVRVATIVGGNLAIDFDAGKIVDGVILEENDRILLKDQGVLSENGIYIVQNVGIPVRSNDALSGTPASVIENYYVHVNEGVVNTDTTWVCTLATGPIGVGNLVFSSTSGFPISWVSYIPQEKKLTERRALGFYSSPLELFRTYIEGSFSFPNKFTPPPLNYWNPPVGGATHQLQPYPRQTVPTYTSNTFNVLGRTGLFYVILSGYGVYDLRDWTYRLNPSNTVNTILTIIGRKLLLFALTTTQSYRDEDTISLIINSNVTSNNSASDYFGYGDFQRFIPGPGIGSHYQPGTTDNGNPTVASGDSPIPFPYFRGNVWGPYNSPGDRFQKLGLRDVLQDLFLNGDTRNLFGTNIIKPWVSVESLPLDNTFGIYFPAFIDVTFGSIDEATNPNITNAMRLIPNGYGAFDITTLGNGNTFTRIFQNAGGQGPNTFGVPISGLAVNGGSAWVNNGVLGGTGMFGDEIGVGPSFIPGSGEQIVENADASYVGDGVGDVINYRKPNLWGNH